ncbi:MAG TPA: hypothetical protein VM686_35080 [Polyangiaceae bacterium]|nr:hypothetical protein [Polyangiaceae bacterium]
MFRLAGMVGVLALTTSVACGGESTGADGAGGSTGSTTSSGGTASTTDGGASNGGSGRGGLNHGGTESAGTSGSGGSATTPEIPEESPCELPDDGSVSALTFVGTTGGGNLDFEPAVFVEGGYDFLVIDEQRRYWARPLRLSPVRTGLLSEQEAADFAEDLKLGQWSQLPPPDLTCVDGASLNLRHGDEFAPPLGCGEDETELYQAYHAWLELLHERGTDLEGDVSYTLAPGPEEDLAVAWPLEGDPAEIADPYHEDARPRLASGEEAMSLRSARAAYLGSLQAGQYPGDYVPITYESAANTTTHYGLVMRDVTPVDCDIRFNTDHY